MEKSGKINFSSKTSVIEKDQSKVKSNVLLLVLTVIITGVSMLTSFQPLWANIPLNIIIPIIVLLKLKTVFFEKLKLSTLLIMRTLIVFAVLGVISGDFYVNLVLIFLGINILEATFTDLKRKKYYNVVTGLVMVASIFLLKGVWLGKYYVASSNNIYGMIAWIIAYTIWNWIFVTNEFSPSIAKLHVGILAAPIIGSLITGNPGFWLIFRGNSLTTGGNIQIANKEYLEENLKDSSFTRLVNYTKKDSVQLVLMIVNLVLMGITLAFTLA